MIYLITVTITFAPLIASDTMALAVVVPIVHWVFLAVPAHRREQLKKLRFVLLAAAISKKSSVTALTKLVSGVLNSIAPIQLLTSSSHRNNNQGSADPTPTSATRQPAHQFENFSQSRRASLLKQQTRKLSAPEDLQVHSELRLHSFDLVSLVAIHVVGLSDLIDSNSIHTSCRSYNKILMAYESIAQNFQLTKIYVSQIHIPTFPPSTQSHSHPLTPSTPERRRVDHVCRWHP
eukprot:TRINITY_DN5756_c1_g2_i1.p1 TRINITY_DN5756_c1_g2~~TRINITY_DN5756_c1_g2_i1.p1  ORF type:complete len:234 (-),score=26.95 TRINITY_DN5756_c1_g2_i1:195-896(-)